MEEAFASSRSTFDVGTQSSQQPTMYPSFTPKASLTQTKSTKATSRSARKTRADPDQDQPPEIVQEDDPITMGAPHLLLDPEPTPSNNQLGRTVSEQPDITGPAQPAPLLDPEVEGDGDISQANHPDEVDGSQSEEQDDVPIREQVIKPLALGERRSASQAPQTNRPDEADGSREDGEEGRPVHVQVVSATDRIRALRALRQSSKRSARHQTVLSTKDASWNLGRSENGKDAHDVDDDGPRKRLRLAERDGRTSFRFTLSQFARTGSKVPKTSGHQFEDESLPEIDGTEEQDQLTEDDEAVNVPPKIRAKPPSSQARRRSEALLDDEDAMDVDVSESVRPPTRLEEHPTQLTPQAVVINEDVPSIIDLTDDDLSMTLIDDVNSPTTHSKDRLQPTTLRCDLDKIRHAWVHLEQAKSTTSGLSSVASQVRDALDAASIENVEDNAMASAALSRIISKTDFNKMQVIGQFNLGFIVTRRQKFENGLDDLFIIDQHAADEKYNFETLQQTTVIESQKLFR